MKRARILILLLLMFSLTGCIREYNYTEEQSDSAAEYLAGKLLEQDKYYKDALLPLEEIVAEPVVTDTPTKAPAQSSDEAPSVTETAEPTEPTEPEEKYTLSEVIGTDHFDIQYEGYDITDGYPDDPTASYFTVTPSQGNQLAIVTFLLTNKTDKKKTLNLTKADIQYRLDINSNTVYKPSLTLIEHDLQYLDIALKGNEKKQVLLVFEIKKEKEISDISLTVSHGEKSKKIVIK